MKAARYYRLNRKTIFGLIGSLLVLAGVATTYQAFQQGTDTRSRATIGGLTIFKQWEFDRGRDGWGQDNNASTKVRDGNLVVTIGKRKDTPSIGNKDVKASLPGGLKKLNIRFAVGPYAQPTPIREKNKQPPELPIPTTGPTSTVVNDNLCNVFPGTCKTKEDWERGWYALRFRFDVLYSLKDKDGWERPLTFVGRANGQMQELEVTLPDPQAIDIDRMQIAFPGQPSGATIRIDYIRLLGIPTPKCQESLRILNPKGVAPYTVELSAGGEAAGSGGIVEYQRDFEGDGVWDASTYPPEGSHMRYTYAKEGEYQPKYRIKGQNNAWSQPCGYKDRVVVLPGVKPTISPVTPTPTPTPYQTVKKDGVVHKDNQPGVPPHRLVLDAPQPPDPYIEYRLLVAPPPVTILDRGAEIIGFSLPRRNINLDDYVGKKVRVFGLLGLATSVPSGFNYAYIEVRDIKVIDSFPPTPTPMPTYYPTSTPLPTYYLRPTAQPTFSISTPTPSYQVGCAEDVRGCPDGTYVSRQPPGCEFAACPGQ